MPSQKKKPFPSFISSLFISLSVPLSVSFLCFALLNFSPLLGAELLEKPDFLGTTNRATEESKTTEATEVLKPTDGKGQRLLERQALKSFIFSSFQRAKAWPQALNPLPIAFAYKRNERPKADTTKPKEGTRIYTRRPTPAKTTDTSGEGTPYGMMTESPGTDDEKPEGATVGYSDPTPASGDTNDEPQYRSGTDNFLDDIKRPTEKPPPPPRNGGTVPPSGMSFVPALSPPPAAPRTASPFSPDPKDKEGNGDEPKDENGNGTPNGDNGSGENGETPADTDCAGVSKDPTGTKADLQVAINDLEDEISKIERTINQLHQDKGNEVIVRKYPDRNFENEIATLEAQQSTCKSRLRRYKSEVEAQNEISETCKEAYRELDDSFDEYSKACSSFARGSGMKCVAAIETCANCPDTGPHSSYNCVSVHQRAQCPELAGQELEAIKEKTEDIEGREKELKEKIEDLSKEISDKDNELREEMSRIQEEFEQNRRELDSAIEEQKAELEAGLREGQGQLKGKLSEQLAGVQAIINQSMESFHEIENAGTKAHAAFRAANRTVRRECRAKAEGRLASHRKRRRKAIKEGRLTISSRVLLSRGRESFSAGDERRFKGYYDFCIKQRKADFKDIKTGYENDLRVIEQKKEQYMDKITRLKTQLRSLHRQAAEQDQGLLQSYTSRMNQIISSSETQTRSLFESHEKAMKEILEAEVRIIQPKKIEGRRIEGQLYQTRQEMNRLRQIKFDLEQRGVSEEDQNQDEFQEAVSALNALEDDIRKSMQDCGCLNSSDYDDECSTFSRRESNADCKEHGKCKEVRNKEAMLMESGARVDAKSFDKSTYGGAR